MDDAQARAVKVLTESRWLVLGTIDADGPWTAALAHTYVPNTGFYVVSQRNSRHGRAIANNGNVSGVLCDSAPEPVNVESIQFTGQATEVSDDLEELQRLMALAHPELTASEIQKKAAEIASDPTKAMYYVVFKDMYVLDQEAWKSKGVDARMRVDTQTVLDLYNTSRRQ